MPAQRLVINQQLLIQVSALLKEQTDQNNNLQGQVNGDFGGRHGHDGGRSGQGALSVIITYFGIMAIIIIPTYYLEKRILRKKRKLKEIHNQNLVESH